jgi:hypothetical protein
MSNDSLKVFYQVMLNVMENAPLYEILWDLKSLFPSASPEELFQKARHTLRELYQRGWVEFHKEESAMADTRILLPDEVETILSGASWGSPDGDGTACIAAVPTDQGVHEWSSGFRSIGAEYRPQKT